MSASGLAGWTDYDTHARTRPRDDLWGQVRRTVRGRAVGPEQIDEIVGMIRWRLGLGAGDVLLDLACGNGALTARLQGDVAASMGVDVSGFLIEVARERFAGEAHDFFAHDAAAFVETTADAGEFTKALCYGGLSYMDDATVRRMLCALHARFPALERVLLGNLPDPARAGLFYAGALPDLRVARSDIGVWRGADELAALAGPGWRLSVSVMPPAFYAAHYRFDALLVRA